MEDRDWLKLAVVALVPCAGVLLAAAVFSGSHVARRESPAPVVSSIYDPDDARPIQAPMPYKSSPERPREIHPEDLEPADSREIAPSSEIERGVLLRSGHERLIEEIAADLTRAKFEPLARYGLKPKDEDVRKSMDYYRKIGRMWDQTITAFVDSTTDWPDRERETAISSVLHSLYGERRYRSMPGADPKILADYFVRIETGRRDARRVIDAGTRRR